jgi:DNA-binding MarR family transcriptional regulator
MSQPEPGERDSCDDHVSWAVREWPQIDSVVEGIVTRVGLVDRHLHRSAGETLEQVGLSHGEFKVLIRLVRGPRSPGDIARELLVSTGTMTNRLDKLEAGGLIRRQPDPADRRGVLLEVTPAGRRTLDRYIEAQAGRERDLLSGLTAAERRDLADLLRKVLTSIEAGASGGPRRSTARHAS